MSASPSPPLANGNKNETSLSDHFDNASKAASDAFTGFMKYFDSKPAAAPTTTLTNDPTTSPNLIVSAGGRKSRKGKSRKGKSRKGKSRKCSKCTRARKCARCRKSSRR